MQQYFYEAFDRLTSELTGGEVMTAYLSGEESDFCRLSQARIRQAGHVKQSLLDLRLIRGQRSVQANLGLSGDRREDESRLRTLLQDLRAQLAVVPEDPYLLYATEVQHSEKRTASALPRSVDAVGEILQGAAGLDLVGIYAAGSIYRGFANSLGQRNWFETHSFNFDFSLYLRGDQAVKAGYAGFQWDGAAYDAKLAQARTQLAVLAQPVRQLSPSKYRVYLAPAAVGEIADLLMWGGFSLKAQKTKQTPLLKMTDGDALMSPLVTMTEDTAGGIAPGFSETGFIKPAKVTLIEAGQYHDALVSPRSAREYGATGNGASDGESPLSFAMAPGSLPTAGAASALETGIFVNNLWYLNFSDRAAGRLTGMTRFASFWVEGGEIIQPLGVMRFDQSCLRLFGDKLSSLTAEREFLPSASTYGQRSVQSLCLPGAVIDEVQFTL